MASYSMNTAVDQLPVPSHSADLMRLEFSHNWNDKLTCLSYTTLRLANSDLYPIGQRVAVYLADQHMHDAEIIAVKTLQIDEINEWIAQLDTGSSRDNCIEIIQEIYKERSINWTTQKLNLVLLRKLNMSITV